MCAKKDQTIQKVCLFHFIRLRTLFGKLKKTHDQVSFKILMSMKIINIIPNYTKKPRQISFQYIVSKQTCRVHINQKTYNAHAV